MPRPPRADVAGEFYHALNRGCLAILPIPNPESDPGEARPSHRSKPWYKIDPAKIGRPRFPHGSHALRAAGKATASTTRYSKAARGFLGF